MTPTSTKFETFIKLLKMTTSDNSGEALVAIRKANAMLKEFGGDWEDLLRGRVQIMADPFTSVPAPPPRRTFDTPFAPPPRPAPPPPPRPPQPGPGYTWNPITDQWVAPKPTWSRPSGQRRTQKVKDMDQVWNNLGLGIRS